VTGDPGAAAVPGPPHPPSHLDLRGTVAVLTGLAIAVAAVLPFLLWWHRLPSPMAVHWNAAGTADGAMAKAAAAALSMMPAALCGLGAAALCLPAAAGLRSPGTLAAAKLACIAAGIGTLLAVTAWSMVAANVGTRTWHGASRLGLPLIALGILAGIAVLLGMAWLTQAQPRAAAPGVPPAAARPAAGPSPAGRAAWTGRARLTWWVPVVLVVAAAVNVVLALARGAALVLIIPLGALLLVYLALGWIRVSVDWRGLRIHYGLLPWPVTTVPLSRIQAAERIDLKPMQWGGWGYRGSRAAFGRAAVVLRGGEAIRLRLTGGGEFAVTVDGAAAGAALLTDLLAAAPTPT
jgi:Domain of unknown function (DUF1648)